MTRTVGLQPGNLIAAPAPEEEVSFTELKVKMSNGWRRDVVLEVASKNEIKINAAAMAVKVFLKFNFNYEGKISYKYFDAPSEIPEQPHDEIGHIKKEDKETIKGAQNRLKFVRDHSKYRPNCLIIRIAMENGLFEEKIPSSSLKTPELVLNDKGNVWVDRCCIAGEMEYIENGIRRNVTKFEATSEGVTTPAWAVEEARKTLWSKTAGSFLQTEYNWNNKDWHNDMAGKSRQTILSEVCMKALDLQGVIGG